MHSHTHYRDTYEWTHNGTHKNMWSLTLPFSNYFSLSLARSLTLTHAHTHEHTHIHTNTHTYTPISVSRVNRSVMLRLFLSPTSSVLSTGINGKFFHRKSVISLTQPTNSLCMKCACAHAHTHTHIYTRTITESTVERGIHQLMVLCEPLSEARLTHPFTISTEGPGPEQLCVCCSISVCVCVSSCMCAWMCVRVYKYVVRWYTESHVIKLVISRD